MREYVVECAERDLTYNGRRVVVPLTRHQHVHERVIRCRDCGRCRVRGGGCAPMYVCEARPEHHFRTRADGFCHLARPIGSVS